MKYAIVLQLVADVIENMQLKLQFQSQRFDSPISHNKGKISVKDKSSK